jgi:hypothetical protein
MHLRDSPGEWELLAFSRLQWSVVPIGICLNRFTLAVWNNSEIVGRCYNSYNFIMTALQRSPIAPEKVSHLLSQGASQNGSIFTTCNDCLFTAYGSKNSEFLGAEIFTLGGLAKVDARQQSQFLCFRFCVILCTFCRCLSPYTTQLLLSTYQYLLPPGTGHRNMGTRVNKSAKAIPPYPSVPGCSWIQTILIGINTARFTYPSAIDSCLAAKESSPNHR